MTTNKAESALKRARKEAGLTQKQLALVSGVGEATIRNIELGIANPKPATLMKIAEPLGLHYLELLDDPAMFFEYQDDALFLEFRSRIGLLKKKADRLELSEAQYKEQCKELFETFITRLLATKDSGGAFDELLGELVSIIKGLNVDGKEKVIDFAKDLAGNPAYQKSNDE